mmetsp:Transcript_19410/g.29465  ORF Transcript_19410/g.29465 Transcript_19410/m.29465 type:complete len:105 (+) Transcript_19410:1-315(+)
MLEAVSERLKLRKQWWERERDPIFSSMSEDCRPIVCKHLDSGECNDLAQILESLREWRKAFVSQTKVMSNGSKSTNSQIGNLTKKEQKKVSSNWERMRLTMSKK